MQKRTFEFLGLCFQNLDMEEALDAVERFIVERTPHMVFTPNAELLVRAHSDTFLRNVYEKSYLLLDSFVVYYFARWAGIPAKGPVSAARLMLNLLPLIEKKGYRIYLLGATEDVVKKVVSRLRSDYPHIKIVGWHDGYFDKKEQEYIVSDIKDKVPDILFVAMSSPLKERFIGNNYLKMMVPVCIGVGGTFDIIAGKCKLAPLRLSRLGLEWLYRLLQEPKRLYKRYLITNTKFILLWLKWMVGNKRR